MYDLIVVGLGAAGAATAYQAAKRGASVLGIDQYSPPHAMGSSHGDTRITRVAIGEGEAYVPLVQRSHEIWREIEALTGETLLVVTGGLVISGPARRATTHVPQFFEKTLAAAEHFSIAHERLDAAAIRKRFPQFNVSDNEVGYYEPGAGYVRPEACIAAQLALAAKHGATLARNERVVDITEQDGVVHVRTDAAEHQGREAVVAVGAWLPDFLEPDLARFFTISRQVLYWFAVDEPIERYEAPRFPIWIWELQDRTHVIYGFPAVDGAAGGVKIATEQYVEATSPRSVEREVSAEEKRAMHRDLVAPYLPGVGARCVKAVSCLYTATPDFHFAIDRHPRLAHVTLASPCSGHGFKHSAALGEGLAELALEGRSTVDLAPFGLARFRNV
jgi:sarcosine oxidase